MFDGWALVRETQTVSAHSKLKEWWAKTGVLVPIERISDDRIVALEARYKIRLPPDFRAYLSESSPVRQNWDEEMGNWWPFSRIKNIPEEYDSRFTPENADKYLFFLDHCVWCWAWAISCADDATYGSIVTIGGPEKVVAASFSEFVDRYVSDWLSVS